MHIEARKVKFTLTLFLNFLATIYVEVPDVTFNAVRLSSNFWSPILIGLTTFLWGSLSSAQQSASFKLVGQLITTGCFLMHPDSKSCQGLTLLRLSELVHRSLAHNFLVDYFHWVWQLSLSISVQHLCSLIFLSTMLRLYKYVRYSPFQNWSNVHKGKSW